MPHLVSCAESGLRYLRQNDGGWATTLVDRRPCADASLVLDRQGQAHIVYAQGGDDLDAQVHARWTGTAWVTDTVDVCGYLGGPVLTADAMGILQMVYSYDESLRHAQWSGATWVTATVDVDQCANPSLALDSKGAPQIACATLDSVDSGGDSWDELRYGRWDGRAWLTTTIASGLSLGPQLTLDKTGTLHIGYYSAGAGGLRYARRSGGAWVVETVDGREGETSGDFSLVLDGEGVPHISFHRREGSSEQLAGWLWYAVRR